MWFASFWAAIRSFSISSWFFLSSVLKNPISPFKASISLSFSGVARSTTTNIEEPDEIDLFLSGSSRMESHSIGSGIFAASEDDFSVSARGELLPECMRKC